MVKWDLLPIGLKSKYVFGAYYLILSAFVLKVILYSGRFRLFWVVGRVVGKAKIITNSTGFGAEAELGNTRHC